MEDDLIYDVGMHKGRDTAHYLDAGYRVVAIEADPSLAADGRQRFSSEIASGRLTILDVAIGPEEGTLPFWISTKSEYSSFSREKAGRLDESCHRIEVRTRPFEDILAEFGVPYYLKIDIEGADHYCLEALDPSDLPRFLSFERNRLEDLLTARALGYSRFKFISQWNFRQMHYQPEETHRSPKLPKRLRRRLGQFARRVVGADRVNRVKHMLSKSGNAKRRSLEPENYARGSSGPFGDETDGPWRTMEEVALSWLAFDLGYTGSDWLVKRAKQAGKLCWFDVHCAL